jgi:hypothetical protein
MSRIKRSQTSRGVIQAVGIGRVFSAGCSHRGLPFTAPFSDAEIRLAGRLEKLEEERPPGERDQGGMIPGGRESPSRAMEETHAISTWHRVSLTVISARTGVKFPS